MGAAEALGREIDDDERAVVVSERPAASTMYLGLDGTGVPVRKEAVEGRAGKQPGDGTAKTHEVKLVTVWTAETRNKEGRPMRDPGSVTYSAVIASAASRDTDREPSVFAQHTRREVERSCFVQAEQCVVLGDGAPWIWGPADEMLPGALGRVGRGPAGRPAGGPAPACGALRGSAQVRRVRGPQPQPDAVQGLPR